jgi:hypothetical protein
LGSEEYEEVVEHHDSVRRLRVKPEAEGKRKPDFFFNLELVEDLDPNAQVRISDLRLANDIKPLALRRKLKSVLDSLEHPSLPTHRPVEVADAQGAQPT